MIDYEHIVCPYCFSSFSHEDFEFRSEFCFTDEGEMEFADESGIPLKERKKYLAGQSYKYKQFWSTYGGVTTEATVNRKEDKANSIAPYDLPVIHKQDIREYIYDGDGFVVGAYDKYNHQLGINHKVCPHCNNPIPNQYGKFPSKRISIIGIKGSGKTVYISQLLKDIGRYTSKVGLSAVSLSAHERNFTENNKVRYNTPLPEGTLPETLCQPMFYDIGRSNDNGTRDLYTIVLYDIAGENCEDANKMLKFSKFVQNSDGLILLLDPSQLGIGEDANDDVKAASEAINTLHNVFVNSKDKCKIPIAVCLSKSDMYGDVLPDIARDDVQPTGIGRTGNNKQEFNASDFNRLSKKVYEILNVNASELCNTLYTSFWFYNYFCLCAIGCDVDASTKCPVSNPNPKRIEEPMYWLLKHFGFISVNENVKMPNPIFVDGFKEEKVRRFLFQHIERVPTEIKIDTEEELVKYLNRE